MAGFHTVQLTDLAWQNQAPNIDPASFLLAPDGSNRLNPLGHTVVFVKEGFWAQRDLVCLPHEDPRWTSGLLRRWQELHFTNLKRFSRFGAPTTERLGLVEVCKVVGASYHKRLLSGAGSKSLQTQRPGTADTAVESSQTTQDISTPQATAQREATAPAAGSELSPHGEVQPSIPGSSTTPTAYSPPPPADATPENPPGEVPDPPPVHPDSDAEDGVNVDVDVKAPRGNFFVRLTLQRAGINSYAHLPLTTTVDFYVDSGSGEWLIPKNGEVDSPKLKGRPGKRFSRSRYDDSLKLNWRRGKRFKMWWEAPDTPGVGMWWTGAVLGRVQRDRFDPRRSSPWEALRVKWDSGDQESCVSMWEIEKDEGQWRLFPDEVEVVEEEAVWQADWSSDESDRDAGESSDTSARRPKRQRRRRQVELPGEVEREQHLRDPKRRRQNSRLQQGSSASLEDVEEPQTESFSVPVSLHFASEASPDEHMPQIEDNARSHARQAKLDGKAGRKQAVGLSGAPSLPQRRPAQRGPTLPSRRVPASAPARAGQQAGAKAPRPQPAPLLAQSASAGPAAAPQAPQPAQNLARSTSSGPSTALQSVLAPQQARAQNTTPQSDDTAQAAVGAAAAPVAPIVLGLPAAGLLQQQPTPQQQAVLQAVMQDPGLQAVAVQPHSHASAQLLQAIFNQHIQALNPSQRAPQAQDVAHPRPQAYPMPQTQPQPHAQPAAAAQAAYPPVRRFKPLEPVRGRRTADILQQERGTGSQGPTTLPTHRVLRPNTKQPKDWNSLFCSRCGEDGDVLGCDGICLRSFHRACLTPAEQPQANAAANVKWYCPECKVGRGVCSICRETGVVGQSVYKCKMGSCGHYLHYKCLKAIDAAGQYLKIHREAPNAALGGAGELVFTCPSHFCQVCHLSGDAMKMLRCWRCPQAYHSRCVPKAARRLTSKSIECEACGLVRAGRAQAMSPMFCSPDAAAAMLHAPAPNAAAAVLMQPLSVATPLSAAHKVSLGTPVSPLPAVNNSHLGLQGSTPFVAHASILSTALPAPSKQAAAQVLIPSVASPCNRDLPLEQAIASLNPSAPPSAIRSYSPADAVTQNLPAVAIHATDSSAAQQTAWEAHQMPMTASKEAPATATHANGDLAAFVAEDPQAAQAAKADTQLTQGTTEASQAGKPASNGLTKGTMAAATPPKPLESPSKESDVEMLASEESEAEEGSSEQETSGADSLEDVSNSDSGSNYEPGLADGNLKQSLISAAPAKLRLRSAKRRLRSASAK